MAWTPGKSFKKTVSKFEMTAYYDGYPHWHTIVMPGVTLNGLTIDDLKDLKYLLERAIEHHEIHGDPR